MYSPQAPQLAKEGLERGEKIYCVNQWQNTANRMAHYLSTGPEILYQTKGKIDVFCAATGTGGTIGGISRFLKENSPKTKVVLLDCFGSALYNYRQVSTRLFCWISLEALCQRISGLVCEVERSRCASRFCGVKHSKQNSRDSRRKAQDF